MKHKLNQNWRSKPNGRTLAIAAAVAVLHDQGWTRAEIADELELPQWLVNEMVSWYCDLFVHVTRIDAGVTGLVDYGNTPGTTDHGRVQA